MSTGDSTDRNPPEDGTASRGADGDPTTEAGAAPAEHAARSPEGAGTPPEGAATPADDAPEPPADVAPDGSADPAANDGAVVAADDAGARPDHAAFEPAQPVDMVEPSEQEGAGAEVHGNGATAAGATAVRDPDLWDDIATDEDEPVARQPEDAAFLVGAVAGLVVLGLIWFGVATLRDDPAPDETAGSATESIESIEGAGSGALGEQEPASGEQQPASAAQSVAERCEAAAGQVGPAVTAAVPAMDQWQVHVVAMNQLVAGEITLEQASAFWSRTRVGAKRKINRFDEADAAIHAENLDCPPPQRLGDVPKDVRSCAQRVDADARTVELARVATDTWRTHVEHMEMLRMGHMSPADATAAWAKSWKKGQREIDIYQEARATARQAGDC